jgi:hypothetical protein
MTQMATQTGTTLPRPGRDPRADICRGLALWMIVINHTPGNWLGGFTLKNFAFADATEAFVLLAGYAGAFAYAGQADRQGWAPAAASLVRRIAKLYVSHIFLLVVFTAQVGFSAATLDRATYLDELALDPFAEQPYRTLLEALLLRFQPHFLDILPLYIVLLALLIPGLLLRGHPWAVLTLSVGLWLGVRAAGFNLPRWQEGGWFFNPLAWQLLFVAGFMLGQAARGAPSIPLPPRNLGVAALALAVLALGAFGMITSEHFPHLVEQAPLWVSEALVSIDKTSLHPARLASILALAYLVAAYVPRDWGFLTSAWVRPFAAMGRHSLPVFCFGILLSFFARLLLEHGDGWSMQLTVNLFCFTALLAVAWMADWSRETVRPRAQQPAALPASLPVGNS